MTTWSTAAAAQPAESARRLIAIENLSLGLPTHRPGVILPVLDDINLEIEEGELVCLVGPSGCGKTTLLNVLAGFQPWGHGQVLVSGRPVDGPHRRRILVCQQSSVFPWLTVSQNVELGLQEREATARRESARRQIETVGLAGFEDAYPRQLSGGMIQRVEIARALAAGPEVIYMDEPFGALDCLTRMQLRADLLRLWSEQRKTILFVTHDIDEAVQLADRVVVMSPRPGRIRAIVPVAADRPRDVGDPGCLEARARILAEMGPAAAPAGEPLPSGSHRKSGSRFIFERKDTSPGA